MKSAVRVGEGRVRGRKVFGEVIQDGCEAVILIETRKGASGELYMVSEKGDTLTGYQNCNL